MKPRELSEEECGSLLSSARVGHLGLSLGDSPYVIPISYVFDSGKILLHSRGDGKKLEMAHANPMVCFQVDSMDGGRWRSVVVQGRASLFDDIDAKRRMFDAFTSSGMAGHAGKAFRSEDLDRMEMTVWEIELLEVTGREGIW